MVDGIIIHITVIGIMLIIWCAVIYQVVSDIKNKKDLDYLSLIMCITALLYCLICVIALNK